MLLVSQFLHKYRYVLIENVQLVCVCVCAQPVHRENMGLTVHKTVLASTTGPVTVLPAPAAVLLDTMATPVNTVCKHSLMIQKETW